LTRVNSCGDASVTTLPCSLDGLQKQASFVHLHSKALTNELFKRAGKMGFGNTGRLGRCWLRPTATRPENQWVSGGVCAPCSQVSLLWQCGSRSSLRASCSNCRVLKWRYWYWFCLLSGGQTAVQRGDLA